MNNNKCANVLKGFLEICKRDSAYWKQHGK